MDLTDTYVYDADGNRIVLKCANCDDEIWALRGGKVMRVMCPNCASKLNLAEAGLKPTGLK